MAIVRAVKSGNWSDPTVWNTGALPTSADDVYSNTFTVTIDVSPTVLSISPRSASGVTAGGGFSANAGITLTCTAAIGVFGGSIAGATLVVPASVSSGQVVNINANIQGGDTTNATVGVQHNGAGTLNIVGNVAALSGGTSGSHAVNNASTGIVSVTGSVNGALTSSAGTTYAVNNNSSGTIVITGSVTGGNREAIVNASTGSITVTGAVSGGSAAVGYGLLNASTGTITHVGTAQASVSCPAIGPGAIGQVTILTGPLISTDGSGGTAAASGVNPCIAQRWFPADTALATLEYRMRGATVSGSPSARPARRFFLTEAYDSLYPATSNVRNGTTYGPGGANTGTLAVPPAGSVALGVPVGNTIGTAAIDGASIRAALGLASANLDSKLDVLPTATEAATAVRTELTTELSRIDANVSSRLAPSGTLARVTLADTVTTLTNAPDVPTESEIADAVRTELTPELARLSNAATVQNVADIVEGAFDLPES